MTRVAGNRRVCAGKFKLSRCVLVDRERWPEKRSLVMTRATIALAERAGFELALVWVFVAVLASGGRAVKDANEVRMDFRPRDGCVYQSREISTIGLRAQLSPSGQPVTVVAGNGLVFSQ